MQQNHRPMPYRDDMNALYLGMGHVVKREPTPNIKLRPSNTSSLILNELKSYEVYDFEKPKYDVHELEKQNFELYKTEKQNHESRRKSISDDVFNYLVNPLLELPPIDEGSPNYNDMNNEISIFFSDKS